MTCIAFLFRRTWPIQAHLIISVFINCLYVSCILDDVLKLSTWFKYVLHDNFWTAWSCIVTSAIIWNWSFFVHSQFKKSDAIVEDGKLPYSYGFFHFVFAMGAMYFAMLFVGWNLHQTMHRYGWPRTGCFIMSGLISCVKLGAWEGLLYADVSSRACAILSFFEACNMQSNADSLK